MCVFPEKTFEEVCSIDISKEKPDKEILGFKIANGAHEERYEVILILRTIFF